MARMAMAVPRVTARQATLLERLTLSSCFSQQEHEATMRWLCQADSTKEQASVLIERAFARLRERDERKKASESRKQAFKSRLDDPQEIVRASIESGADRDRRFGRR